MVPKGNPKHIAGLKDLTAPGIRIGQGDEKAAAVGRLMPRLLQLNGVERTAWNNNVLLNTPTVNELAMAVKLGTVDAAVVWDAVARKYSDCAQTVAITNKVCPPVGAAVLSFSKDKAAAAAFLEFMNSERGKEILTECGYSVNNPGNAK